MLDVEVIRKDFPMYKNKVTMQGQPLVFLDNASTTFKPRSVIDKVNRYYCFETSNSHRGDYDLCFEVDNQVGRSRKAVARFIDANENEVVFTAGTTGSLNLVAYGYALHNLKAGDEILLSEAEHASNMLPWFTVAKMVGAKINYVPLAEDGRLTVENFKKAITAKTKFVSLAYVGNVLGYIAPIKEMIAIAHEYGAVFCVDGAQAVPHLKIDVKDLDCDFLAFSSHKMLGPTGIGALYGKYSLLQKAEPFESGGGMNAKFYCSGDAIYLDPPFKFEAGTQNLASIYGFEEAIIYLEKIGLENIQKHEFELKQYAVKKLKELGNVKIYNENSESGIITFNIDNVFSQDAATYLNSKGIAVRSGQHCAKTLVNFLGTPATVRASLYLYNDKTDIDRLVEATATGGNFLDAYFI